MTTWQNNTARTGQNLTETTLTPANVNSTQFGRLFSVVLDGSSYTQPLYLPQVSISGAIHNVVFATTEHDSVYAFDAESNGGENSLPLWKASLLDAAHGAKPGATPVTEGLAADITPEYGITGTPVIDPDTGTLYVVSFTQENSAYLQRLHALDIKTGTEKFGGPVKIEATVPGTGSGSVGGVLSFDAKWENQRPALLLQHGIVYIGYAAHGDNGPWHGWILGYNARTLAQTGVYCTSPNGFGSGIWMSGAGLAGEIDDPTGHPFGRMFFATGNGNSNPTIPYTNQMNYGEAHLNLDLSNGQPTVTDQFTTNDYPTLNAEDGDVGAGGLLLVPDQAGTVPHILIQAGKRGMVYVINRDNMGGYSLTGDNILQEVRPTKHTWSGPAFWNGRLYYWASGDVLKSFAVSNGVLLTTPLSRSGEYSDYPGATPAISANGTTNGIVWTIQTDGYVTGAPAVLQAHDALNVATLLYSSAQNTARDTAGPAVKFQVPTVANGKVYVAANRLLSVYGLLNGSTATAAPVIEPASETISGPITVTITDSTPGTTIYYTTDGSPVTMTSRQYSGPIRVDSTQTIQAIAGAMGYVQSATTAASYELTSQADAPSPSPPGGSYQTAQIVTLSDQTAGAHIYYTVDGSTPSATSTLYTQPIPIDSSLTLKAITIANAYTDSPVMTAVYAIQASGTAVNFSNGFSLAAGLMTFNGSTQLDDSRLQLTSGGTSQRGSAFYNVPLPVTSFTTDFGFQLSNPQADGITFTIQGNSPSVLGSSGAGLGYQGIGQSIAIKFDLYSNDEEGGNSTGLYLNGAAPTIPAVDLSPSGIDLHSGHSMVVHISYDGVTLTLSLSDSVTSKTYSTAWTLNLPQIMGGNAAYFGFTGGTGGLSASQKILTWTYLAAAATGPPLAATPAIHPAGGTFSGPQSISITDSTPGASIYYTTDGSTPMAGTLSYTAPFTVAANETIEAIATAPNYANSPVNSASFTIHSSGVGTPSYGDGFTASGLMLNGGTTVSNGVLHLTTDSNGEARSAFYATPVAVDGFSTDFTFQLTHARADGFAFVIQNQGPTALGSSGPALGFAASNGGPTITDGVAIKFDLWDNSGEGNNSIGVYTSGSTLTMPAQDLTIKE